MQKNNIMKNIVSQIIGDKNEDWLNQPNLFFEGLSPNDYIEKNHEDGINHIMEFLFLNIQPNYSDILKKYNIENDINDIYWFFIKNNELSKMLPIKLLESNSTKVINLYNKNLNDKNNLNKKVLIMTEYWETGFENSVYLAFLPNNSKDFWDDCLKNDELSLVKRMVVYDKNDNLIFDKNVEIGSKFSKSKETRLFYHNYYDARKMHPNLYIIVKNSNKCIAKDVALWFNKDYKVELYKD